MPNLAIRGTWYGGSCQVYSSSQYGDYANLGNVAHTNFSLINGGADGGCGGYKFTVVDNNTGQVVYHSTSSAQAVSLFFDGTEQTQTSKYDCINGACIKNTVYSTPGFYTTLNDCQAACGVGCSGQCIGSADWAQIESLASQLKNHEC